MAALQPVAAVAPAQPSPSPRVALLNIGLLRGLQFPAQRRWLRALVSSLGPAERVSVFGLYEVPSSVADESNEERNAVACRANLELWLNESFVPRERHVESRFLTSAEMAEQTSAVNFTSQYIPYTSWYGLYKTWKAWEMLEANERVDGHRSTSCCARVSTATGPFHRAGLRRCTRACAALAAMGHC